MLATTLEDLARWEKEGFRSKSTGLIFAPEDLVSGRVDEPPYSLHTWDDVTTNYKNFEWRLPTQAELVQIFYEASVTEDGRISEEKAVETLSLSLEQAYDDRVFPEIVTYWTSTEDKDLQDRAITISVVRNSSTPGDLYCTRGIGTLKNHSNLVRLVKEAK